MTAPATNAVAVKAALLAIVEGLAVEGLQVGYGPPPNPERDFVYLGSVKGPIKPATFRTGGRIPRIEDLTLQVHIVATVPGGTSEEVLAAETRVIDITTEIINAVAADHLLGGVPGLKACVVDRMELESGADDDASSAWVTLWFDAKSHLT